MALSDFSEKLALSLSRRRFLAYHVGFVDAPFNCTRFFNFRETFLPFMTTDEDNIELGLHDSIYFRFFKYQIDVDESDRLVNSIEFLGANARHFKASDCK